MRIKRMWWGWHSSRGGRGWGGGWWWFVIPLVFIFAANGWRGGWWLWFLVPAFFFFVVPKLRGMWGDHAHHHDGDMMEKRKHDDTGEKPKNAPIYYVGDDGELTEMPDHPTRSDRTIKPKRDDDPIEYV